MFARIGRLYGPQCRILSIWKQSCRVSYSLSGIDQPPHMSGCVSITDFALLSCNSLMRIFFGWCCLSCLRISLASASSNGGLLSE